MYDMTPRQFYRLKVRNLMDKYKPFYEAYKQYKDDRCLVPGIIDKLVEGCKALEEMENVSVRVAYNRYFQAEEAAIESIVCRFENMYYEDYCWNRKEKEQC